MSESLGALHSFMGRIQNKKHAFAVRRGIMLGSDDSRVCTVLLLKNDKMVKSKHVNVDESCFPGLDKSDSSSG